MAIHYNGAVQRTPGQVACSVVAPQAVTGRWAGADCNTCKLRGLLHLTIQHAEPGSIPGRVVNVSRHELGVRFLEDEPAPTALAFAELDTGNWVVPS